MSIRPIWNKPSLITDWRDEEQEERDTHWTLLFYDLLIVAGVSAISEPFMDVDEDSSSEGLRTQLVPIKHLVSDAVFRFLMIILPWVSQNEYTSVFQDESLAGHIFFFVHLFGIAITAAGCVGDFTEVDNYTNLGRGIVVARLGLILQHIRPYIYIPQSRGHCILRCMQQVVIILSTLWSLSWINSIGTFKCLLLFILAWDLLSFPMTLLFKIERMRIHVAAYADRCKELTIIIFGEAIFSVTLKPKLLNSSSENYYIALIMTLWTIFAFALNEFHLLPYPDDHALRRSILFALCWNYTTLVKTVLLLGVSIGIKRVHYLVWAGQNFVDDDTQTLLFYGISFSLLSVVLVRSYSFGWGKNSESDDPKLAMLKMGWWFSVSMIALSPCFVDILLVQSYDKVTPLDMLKTTSVLLAILVFAEAFLSVSAASMMGVKLESGHNYLVGSIAERSNTSTYGAVDT